MYCRECREKFNNEKSVICIKCGTKRGQGDKYCPECSSMIENKNAEICLNCGVKVKYRLSGIKENLGSGNNSKMTAGLLAFFF
ncbi:hypothetical protein [Clostridium nigeriense]|uniref:hypothetical protein n=1 Tax=Clostridium nigeriense TaxID=1805470 RepID=UPI0008376A51|nr:hypothetical protein [Clostridium nigeriense]